MAVVMSRCIEIDAGHRVPDHGSKCRSLHGHRYKITAFVRGDLIDSGPQKSMVMDFGFLKDAMMLKIHDPFDHSLMLFEGDPLLSPHPVEVCSDFEAALLAHGTKLMKLPMIPTAEGLAQYWANQVEFAAAKIAKARGVPEHFLDRMTLMRLEVWETPNCCAAAAPEGNRTFLEVISTSR